jgi:hypothetical protein
MRLVAGVGLLLLGAGCVTTRVSHLDTGHGEPITYTSVGVEPVEVSEAEFKVALTQLLLDMRMDVAFRESEEADERGWVRSRTLLASAALDTVWSSVEAEVGKMLNPVALKAMLTSAALTVLLTMTLPEPVTKVLAVALTAAMVAYLGVIPVWEMGRGFVRLWDDAGKATSVIELQDIGRRPGRTSRAGRGGIPAYGRPDWRGGLDRVACCRCPQRRARARICRGDCDVLERADSR